MSINARESGVLGALGALLAWPIAGLVGRVLLWRLAPAGESALPRTDAPTLAAAACLALAAWLLGAVLPLGVALRRGELSALRRGSATETRGSSLLRSAALAAQLAASCALLALTGVAADGLRELVRLPLGFAPRDVTVARVAVSAGDLRATLPLAVAALAARPGVVAAAAATQAPFVGDLRWPVGVPGASPRRSR